MWKWKILPENPQKRWVKRKGPLQRLHVFFVRSIKNEEANLKKRISIRKEPVLGAVFKSTGL